MGEQTVRAKDKDRHKEASSISLLGRDSEFLVFAERNWRMRGRISCSFPSAALSTQALQSYESDSGLEKDAEA